jgi:uncharacterized phage protein gp47/JayE
MTWPLPAPGDISARAAGIYEAEFARIWLLRNPGAPVPVVDARSPNSTLAVHGRVLEASAWDLYLYQSRLALELMPDTAQDNLPRFGSIWGVPQDQPAPASGNVLVTGQAGQPETDVPAGEVLSSPTGALYATTAAVTVPAGGGASLPVTASVSGAAGNLGADTVLSFVSGIAGLNPQTATVDENGITGGLDLESTDSWRARIIARIRQRGGGGTLSDYQQWTNEVLPNGVVGQVSEAGIVNIILAVMQPGLPARVPTISELNAVTAYLQDATNRKPLGMEVLVTPATLVPVPVTLVMNPDTAAIEGAATAALQAYFNAAGSIGGTLRMSQLDAALSNGSGETSHDRIAPTEDLVFTATQLPVLGAVTFEAPS